MGQEFEIDYGILAKLGVSSLRDAQKNVVQKMLCADTGSLIAVIPTGGGKTLCFQYYALASVDVLVIVYPLISLMNDQQARFERAGIKAVVLKGGQTKKQRTEIFESLTKGGVRAIITNPATLSSPKV